MRVDILHNTSDYNNEKNKFFNGDEESLFLHIDCMFSV